MLSFAWPFAVVLLLIPIGLHWWLQHRNPPGGSEINPIALPEPLQTTLAEQADAHGTNTGSNLMDTLVIALCWLCLVLALARPTWITDKEILAAGSHNIALAVDFSPSMERKDFLLDGQPADRLSVVRRVLHTFVPARRGDRLALILFGKEAFVAAPLGYDTEHLLHVLDRSRAGIAGRTTAIGDALGLAIDSLRHQPAEHQVIILLSDGNNTAGSVEPESAARMAARLGMRVHTIGLGGKAASQQLQLGQRTMASELDDDALRSIAEIGNGTFFRADSTAALQSIYERIDQLEASSSQRPPVLRSLDLRNLFVAPLLLLCLLHAFNQWLRSRSQ